jgi:hypothetical protein
MNPAACNQRKIYCLIFTVPGSMETRSAPAGAGYERLALVTGEIDAGSPAWTLMERAEH